MRCPRCNGVSAVSHSNQTKTGQYRRRYCTSLACQFVFHTEEKLVAKPRRRTTRSDHLQNRPGEP